MTPPVRPEAENPFDNPFLDAWDDLPDASPGSKRGIRPVAGWLLDAANRRPRSADVPWWADAGTQGARGLAESGYATAQGLTNLLRGADSPAAARVRGARAAMRDYYGDPEGVAGQVALAGGGLLGTGAQFALPGAALGRGAALLGASGEAAGVAAAALQGAERARALTTAARNLGAARTLSRVANPLGTTGVVGAAGRLAAGTALNTPLNLAMAASPEDAITTVVGDVTGNEALRNAPFPVRAAAETAVDLVGGAAFEGAGAALRGARSLAGTGRQITALDGLRLSDDPLVSPLGAPSRTRNLDEGRGDPTDPLASKIGAASVADTRDVIGGAMRQQLEDAATSGPRLLPPPVNAPTRPVPRIGAPATEGAAPRQLLARNPELYGDALRTMNVPPRIAPPAGPRPSLLLGAGETTPDVRTPVSPDKPLPDDPIPMGGDLTPAEALRRVLWDPETRQRLGLPSAQQQVDAAEYAQFEAARQADPEYQAERAAIAEQAAIDRAAGDPTAKLPDGRWATARTPEGGLRPLPRVGDDGIRAEYERLAQQLADEEAQYAAIVEDPRWAAVEALPDAERTGRSRRKKDQHGNAIKRQAEDLPDGDGAYTGEELQQARQVVAQYRKRAAVRAKQQQTLERLQAEMERRGLTAGDAAGTDFDPTSFDPKMFDDLPDAEVADLQGQADAAGLQVRAEGLREPEVPLAAPARPTNRVESLSPDDWEDVAAMGVGRSRGPSRVDDEVGAAVAWIEDNRGELSGLRWNAITEKAIEATGGSRAALGKLRESLAEKLQAKGLRADDAQSPRNVRRREDATAQRARENADYAERMRRGREARARDFSPDREADAALTRAARVEGRGDLAEVEHAQDLLATAYRALPADSPRRAEIMAMQDRLAADIEARQLGAMGPDPRAEPGERAAGLALSRQALESPIAMGAAGGLAGASSDPEDRTGGAVRGALVGALAAGAARLGFAGRDLLRYRRMMGAQGLSPSLASAHATIGSMIDYDGTIAAARAAQERGGLGERARRWADMVADAQRPLDRVGEAAEARGLPADQSPATMLNRALSSDGVIMRAAREGVIDPVTRQTVGPSFDAVWEPFGKNPWRIRQAVEYAVSKRIVGRGESAVAGDPVRWVAAQEVARAGDADPELVAFAGRLRAYTESLGQYAVKSGLWTEAQWRAIQDSDVLYVPFKRLLTGEPGRLGRSKSAMKDRPTRDLANVTDGVQRFTGSDRELANIPKALAEYTAAIIRRADRYRVGASLFDAADVMGLEGEGWLTRIDRSPAGGGVQAQLDNAEQALAAVGYTPTEAAAVADLYVGGFSRDHPVIWRNRPDGGREYAVVQAPELVDALAGLRLDDRNAASRFLTFLKRIATDVATGLSPRFALGTQPARDIPDFFTKNPGGTVADLAVGYVEALRSLAGASPLADQMARQGLSGTSIFAHAEDVEGLVARSAPTTVGQRVRGALGGTAMTPIRTLERVGQATDLAPRLAAARATQRRALARGLSLDEAQALAARAGAQATVDFRRRSAIPLLRTLEGWVPFFGAANKATVRYARAAKDTPGRVAVSSAVTATAVVLARWAQVQAGRADEFADRPDSERAAAVLVPLPGTDRPLKLPLGQEQGMVAAATHVALDRLYVEDPGAYETALTAVARLLPPIAGDVFATATGPEATTPGDLAAAAVQVPGVRGALEVATNRESYSGRAVVPRRAAEGPPEYRRRATTAPTFDALATGARALGISETSPLQVEHITRDVLGSATDAVTAVTDRLLPKTVVPLAADGTGERAVAGRRLPRPSVDESYNPAGAFLGRAEPYTTQSEQAYYRLRDRLERDVQRLEITRPADADAQFERISAQQQALAQAEGEVNEMRAAEQEILTAYNRQAMDGQVARRQLDRLAKIRHAAYRRAMAQARAIERAFGAKGAR